jgi:hypothetical protein
LLLAQGPVQRALFLSLPLVFLGCAVAPNGGEPATATSSAHGCAPCDAEAFEAYTGDKMLVTDQALQYINGVAGYLRSSGTISARRKEAATILFFDMLALVRWLQLRHAACVDNEEMARVLGPLFTAIGTFDWYNFPSRFVVAGQPERDLPAFIDKNLTRRLLIDEDTNYRINLTDYRPRYLDEGDYGPIEEGHLGRFPILTLTVAVRAERINETDGVTWAQGVSRDVPAGRRMASAFPSASP